MQKELVLGLPVRCQDGPAGQLERIVADPEKHEPAYLVVKRGLLSLRHIVLPISLVAEVTGEGVLLNTTREALKTYPDYEITEERHLAQAEWPEWTYPVPYGRPLRHRASVTVRHRNVPPDTVELRRGMTLHDSGGEKLGTVVGLLADQVRKQPTHLVIRRQRLLREEQRLVPVELVDFTIRDDVYLRVTTDRLDDFPPYSHGTPQTSSTPDKE